MIRTLTDQRLVRPATGDDIEIYSKRQNDTWFNRQKRQKTTLGEERKSPLSYILTQLNPVYETSHECHTI